jgi:hypothetical protein
MRSNEKRQQAKAGQGNDWNAGKLRIMNDDPMEDCGDYSRTEPLPPDRSRSACAGRRRLDQVLAELLPQHSRNRLQGWVRDGLVHGGW